MKYALALVNITGLGVKTFSYLIPDEMKEKIQIGQAILVPFGRQGLINAFCVGFSDYLPEGIKAKKVSKILDETPLFSIEYLKLLEWVANYYCCDLVTVLNAAIPMKLIEKACFQKMETGIYKLYKRSPLLCNCKFNIFHFQHTCYSRKTAFRKLYSNK